MLEGESFSPGLCLHAARNASSELFLSLSPDPNHNTLLLIE